MGYGGYHPYPRRFGGNRHEGKPLTELLHESLNAQRGPAYDTESSTSIVRLENLAYSRALACDGWEVNDRLALQWDPLRTTDMLPRWERIFRLRPGPTVSETERRTDLRDRWQLFGAIANQGRIVTELQERLGSYLVAVEYISLANAIVHAPDGSYPWGTVATGYTWYSTVAHFLVRLQKPTGATEGDFYEAAGQVSLVLDPLVSSFVTFEWYRAPISAAVVVNGGPSAGGFYLDDEHNLDNNVFDA